MPDPLAKGLVQRLAGRVLPPSASTTSAGPAISDDALFERLTKYPGWLRRASASGLLRP